MAMGNNNNYCLYMVYLSCMHVMINCCVHELAAGNIMYNDVLHAHVQIYPGMVSLKF